MINEANKAEATLIKDSMYIDLDVCHVLKIVTTVGTLEALVNEGKFSFLRVHTAMLDWI